MVRSSTGKTLRHTYQAPPAHPDYGDSAPVTASQEPAVFEDHIPAMVRASTGKTVLHTRQDPSRDQDNVESAPAFSSQAPAEYLDHMPAMVRASTGKTVPAYQPRPFDVPGLCPTPWFGPSQERAAGPCPAPQPLGAPLRDPASTVTAAATVMLPDVRLYSLYSDAAPPSACLAQPQSRHSRRPQHWHGHAPGTSTGTGAGKGTGTGTGTGTGAGAGVGAGVPGASGARRPDKRSLVREAHVFDGRRHFADGLTGGAPMAAFEDEPRGRGRGRRGGGGRGRRGVGVGKGPAVGGEEKANGGMGRG